MAAVSISASPSADAPTSRASFGGFDWPLLFLVVFLSLWGVATIASATLPSPDGPIAKIPEALKQIVFVGVGLSLMVALAFANYRWLVHFQGWFYALNMVSLASVLVVGRTINGAKSWIVLGPISLQMSEFSKFALLLCLAGFVARRQSKIGEFKTVILSLLYLAPPLLLILKQPDFGTTLATISIWFGVLFFAGAKWQHLMVILCLGLAAFGGAYATGKLKRHQVERLTAFMHPENVQQEGSYQLTQSLIAIGGGQITGQGYKKGAQNLAHYVPENDTDFIFTVVAEEWGFVGGAVLIACYALLLFRTASLAFGTENYFGILLCGGVTALFLFHCVINIGMTMRVMPITGVPLPFFSKGGSSFMTFALCAGLLQSVSAHRQ